MGLGTGKLLLHQAGAGQAPELGAGCEDEALESNVPTQVPLERVEWSEFPVSWEADTLCCVQLKSLYTFINIIKHTDVCPVWKIVCGQSFTYFC